jgi:hypothetical protein
LLKCLYVLRQFDLSTVVYSIVNQTVVGLTQHVHTL